MIDFKKMHGLGNDFVVIEDFDGGMSLDKNARIQLADRRYGVGCDQILVLAPPQRAEADFLLNLYNPDGSAIEACGNGTRCAARLWMDQNECDRCVIETLAGLLDCRREGDDITVDMGKPQLVWDQIPLSHDMDPELIEIPEVLEEAGVAVGMGNPHCVFFVDDVDAVPLAQIGPVLETASVFPNKANIEFAQVLERDQIRMRVWERGAGITQACGSGACATLVAGVLRDLTDRKADIILDGGTLRIEWRDDDHILMTGPADYVFVGEIKL